MEWSGEILPMVRLMLEPTLAGSLYFGKRVDHQTTSTIWNSPPTAEVVAFNKLKGNNMPRRTILACVIRRRRFRILKHLDLLLVSLVKFLLRYLPCLKVFGRNVIGCLLKFLNFIIFLLVFLDENVFFDLWKSKNSTIFVFWWNFWMLKPKGA